MGGYPFSEIPCNLCGKPVDLTADLCADENGQPVHEHCYVAQVVVSQWQGQKSRALQN